MSLRTIIVDDQTYLWRFEHGYEANDSRGEATSIFTAYRSASKQSPMRIYFRTYDHPTLGSPLNNQFLPVIPNDQRTTDINLYFPRWAANLICHGLTHGWRPEHDKQP